MQPKIISIGFSAPEQSYSQEEVFEELGYPKAFKRMFTKSDIDKRHFWIPLEKITKLSWQQQQEEYIKGAVELAKQAILNCLDGRSTKDIGRLVFSSCTGFAPGPVIPHYLSRELSFAPGTYFLNIGGMGCESGFPGLKVGTDFTLATGKSSLVIATELSSCSYFPEPSGKPDPENHFELIRGNALFADAASCILVSYDDDPRHPTIIDTETYTNTDYLKDLGYVWRQGRLRILLSRRVPTLAALVLKPALKVLLERQKLAISDINWWVIHAAGNTVLDNIRDALQLPEEKLWLSRQTLKNFGNTSSTSVGITGKSLMSQDILPGDYAVVLSVGPGMTGGCTLLQFGV